MGWPNALGLLITGLATYRLAIGGGPQAITWPAMLLILVLMIGGGLVFASRTRSVGVLTCAFGLSGQFLNQALVGEYDEALISASILAAVIGLAKRQDAMRNHQ
ncbi:hypothetical protein [Sphingomonas sp. PP-CC-3G-468]|uniref:hypothetical protein n=1 Tax=Sphingomonas sp. PP-CC-3G-468 TaxID=2135656 RepID=UPI00104C1F95|nr:hypothetical protein [Sphingomonas sp. PP-CC-3G-468]TCM07437.1 hypothetical protein C8J41_103345 [Sphingomonas sp. PP-CC-3G-468]